MSQNITVSIKTKDLLLISSVSIRARFNGTLLDAVKELRTNDPDVGLVEAYLTPVVVLTIPTVCHEKVVGIHKDRVLVSCKDKGPNLSRIAGYCERMNINYSLEKK